MNYNNFHIRELPRCQFEYCQRAATTGIFNTHNASYGIYCTLHGSEKLAELNKAYKDTPPDEMPAK